MNKRKARQSIYLSGFFMVYTLKALGDFLTEFKESALFVSLAFWWKGD